MKKIFFPGEVEVRNLNKEIERVFGQIAVLFFRTAKTKAEEFEVDKFLSAIRADILSGSISDDSISSENIKLVTQKRFDDAFTIPFRHACIYAEMAKISRNRDATEESWYLICQANYKLGLAYGALALIKEDDAHKKYVESASKGGRSKSATYDFDRNEVARLLELHCPDGGYETEKEAAKIISKHLREFIIKSQKEKSGQRSLLNPDRFQRTLLNWINHNTKNADKGLPQGVVRQTYLKTKRSD